MDRKGKLALLVESANNGRNEIIIDGAEKSVLSELAHLYYFFSQSGYDGGSSDNLAQVAEQTLLVAADNKPAPDSDNTLFYFQSSLVRLEDPLLQEVFSRCIQDNPSVSENGMVICAQLAISSLKTQTAQTILSQLSEAGADLSKYNMNKALETAASKTAGKTDSDEKSRIDNALADIVADYSFSVDLGMELETKNQRNDQKTLEDALKNAELDKTLKITQREKTGISNILSQSRAEAEKNKDNKSASEGPGARAL